VNLSTPTSGLRPVGTYENVSAYVRDLIRRDKERVEREGFERLRAELAVAFAAPDDSYWALTAGDVVARNRPRRSA
jgi:antitoxin ParD1/3/4